MTAVDLFICQKSIMPQYCITSSFLTWLNIIVQHCVGHPQSIEICRQQKTDLFIYQNAMRTHQYCITSSFLTWLNISWTILFASKSVDKIAGKLNTDMTRCISIQISYPRNSHPLYTVKPYGHTVFPSFRSTESSARGLRVRVSWHWSQAFAMQPYLSD